MDLGIGGQRDKKDRGQKWSKENNKKITSEYEMGGGRGRLVERGRDE